MKRKRGDKKSTENAENQTSEESSDSPAECDNSEHESKMEVDAPSSTGSGNSPDASVDPSASAGNNAVAKSVARVKVKLKTSKTPEPDVSSRNDITEKSSPQVESEKSVVAAEKKEDPVPRLPEKKPVFLNVYRKTKGIKIKSFKGVDGSSSVIEKSADAVKPEDANVPQKDTKLPNESSQANKQDPESTPIISFQKEEKKTDQNSRYNKQELEDSLTYWSAAGLYTEQSAENAQQEDGGKTKGSHSKQKSHKRHGRHHKSDCMCAICVLKRHKRERERGSSQGHSGAQEESSPAGSQSVGNSSIVLSLWLVQISYGFSYG